LPYTGQLLIKLRKYLPAMGDNHNGTWTPHRVDTLRQLWASGTSSDDMAIRLNTTSGAVRSKIKRLRLNKTRPKRQIRREKPTTASGTPPHYKSTPRYPAPIQGRPEPLVGLGVLLHERTGCAWPLNEGGPYRFCNADRHSGKSYCEAHAERMIRR
jgi:hypothetical protein